MLAACTPNGAPDTGAYARPDLAFAGDVLLHDLIQSDAAGRPEGFAPAFQPIAPALSRAYVTVVNLEGPSARNIAPNHRESADPGTIFDGYIYSGYPTFNYHPSIAAALAQAGVDVVPLLSSAPTPMSCNRSRRSPVRMVGRFPSPFRWAI